MDLPAHRLRLALIFGGRSGEHDVSVVSARSVAAALDRDRYEIVPMAIDRRGRWAEPDEAARVLAESGDRTDQVLAFSGGVKLDPRLLEDAVDVAFPVLHGPFGEDGTIQGLFEMLDLPYVGCDPTASAVCMDKALAKRLLVQAGLKTPAWVELDRESWHAAQEDLTTRCLGLGLPLFVKPARLGSSVGISRVVEPSALDEAVEKALNYGRTAVVERGIDAREIEIAVLGNRRPRASIPGEVVSGHEFYDYEDKYLDNSCELLAPAPLEPEQTAAARRIAIEVFSSLGCAGMARVDLFLERTSGDFWVNEVNTIPGFTSISMYPRLWGLTGLPYPELLDELIQLALQRHRGCQAEASHPSR
ncbi:MAG: D-alanine--D-alanine ligase [Candidatus Aminicenantes bacterium]|nr:MAG: D-alanine--D-alanine ligase [Candidatus Aminicenantes bacterium]